MAALNFPASPTNGQIYTSGSRSWSYNTALGAWEGGTAASSGGTQATQATQTALGTVRGNGTGATGNVTVNADGSMTDNSAVLVRSTQTITFDRDAEHTPQASYFINTAGAVVGAVVAAYLTQGAGASAMPIPAAFILDSGLHLATMRNQYLFKFGADSLFHYSIIPY